MVGRPPPRPPASPDVATADTLELPIGAALDKSRVETLRRTASGAVSISSSIAPSLDSSRMAAADAAPALLAGRYEILGFVAAGGMGSVYRARDTELDEVVALKVLRRELVESPEMLARFRQEVKLARKVTHKNIARMFDIGEHLAERFLTMEFIEGESLGELLERQGRVPLARAVQITVDIAAGLGAAHAAGVVHRDLKPDNVLIERQGRVVITDFGIARAAEASPTKTTGLAIGTPAYMAPEQVEGGVIDARADIYALGEIFYELLTGERPWHGDSIYQVAAARLVHPPPDARAKAPDVPRAAAAVASKCMARRPEDRFADTARVIAELSHLTLPATDSRPSIPPPRLLAMLDTYSTKSVAVLPFRNAGPPEDEYLADSVTEDLVDALSMLDGVRVRPLGTVLALKGRAHDPRIVGTELGVQVTVDGSLRRVGEQLRVSARAVSVAEGFQLWAKRIQRPATEFLEVCDEISDAVAHALTVERGAKARSGPADPEALDLYLRGRAAFQTLGGEGTATAIALLSRALERAPDEALFLTAYAAAHLRRFSFEGGSEHHAMEAERAAERAMKIAPDLPEPYAAVAAIALAYGDEERAAHELCRALAAGPMCGDALELRGRMLLEAMGPPEVSVRSLEAAWALDPRRSMPRFDLARGYELLGDRARCDGLMDKRDFTYAYQYWVTQGRIALWRRDMSGAAELLAQSDENAPSGPGKKLLELVATGTFTTASQSLILEKSRATTRALRNKSFFCQLRVEVLAFLNDNDGALEALVEADSAKLLDVLWIEKCALLAPLREHPAFVEVHGHVAARAARVRDILAVG